MGYMTTPDFFLCRGAIEGLSTECNPLLFFLRSAHAPYYDIDCTHIYTYLPKKKWSDFE